MNEMVVYEAQAPAIVARSKNYAITVGGCSQTLKRNIDFGVIPKTKKPSLFKSGAEKICMAYGLLQHYEIESKIEQIGKDAFFYYAVKCSLVKIGPDGKEYVFTSGFGSANTLEKRNGYNSSAYDGANSALKMAQKRALVSAAISISGVSDMFSQDVENEDFMSKAEVMINPDSPDSPISKNQIMRIYAIAGDAGLSKDQTKQKLAALGFASTKEIKQKDYDRVCNVLEGKETN